MSQTESASVENVESTPTAPSKERARVLVVDDNERMRKIVTRLLNSLGHETEEAEDGIEGLAKLELDPDLILLDAEMPNMDGFDVARHVREDPEHRHVPILMLTGLESPEHRARALEAGVSDFLNKPFGAAELRMRVRSLLALKRASDDLRNERGSVAGAEHRHDLRETLDKLVEARRHTHVAHLDTIRRLVKAAEYKDQDTGDHIERIGLYCEFLAKRLNLAPRRVEMLRHAAPMHDIGKIGIRDEILLKPGRLTPEERSIMERHTVIGAGILRGSPSEVLLMGEVIAESHHEKWNGMGYPHKLQGEAIPLEGRICAVTDFFDALSMKRVYREAVPVSEVLEMMREERAKYFDPVVLDVFLAERESIEEIRSAWS